MTNLSPSLPERVRNIIARYGMIGRLDRVLAAVSGGPDSVALLEILVDLGFSLEIAHFDHQTRGGSSREDAEFVAGLAAGHALEFHLESRPVATEAASSGKSFEHHARDVRYAFLLRVARERGCAVIATGHHADDQAETVLLRLLHGSGPQALAGIPPVRVAQGVRIVRPLIECDRAELLAYLAGRGIAYREDTSNADLSVPRNRVRHELLPLIERNYNRRVRDAILRLAEQQRILNAYLAQQEEDALEKCVLPGGAINRVAFVLLDPALTHRVALHVARAHGVRPDAARVAAFAEFVVLGPAGRRFDLGNGVVLHNNRETTEAVKSPASQNAAGVSLPVPGAVHFLERLFTAELTDNPPHADPRVYCTPQCQVFDADKLGESLSIRTRREGDRFAPLGMKGTRKLSDYLIDLRVPATRRDLVPLIVAGDRIMWVVGHAPAAAAAVSSRTRRFLIIKSSDTALESGDEIE